MSQNHFGEMDVEGDHTNYDRDIDNAKKARNSQLRDTDPMVVKEGFLGVDDLDRLRRRKTK